MATIVLNQNNITNSQNNTLVYKFPNSVQFKNVSIAVQAISMYYSWYNISSSLVNNTFTYTWENATNTQTTYTITIPNGLYEIAQINAYLQFSFIANGHYLVNSSGEYVYYAEFLVSPTAYGVNVITYPFPTALPSGYTNPASIPFPAQTFNPVITLPSAFNKIVGYTAGYATARNLGVNTILTYTSSTSPQVQPNPTLLMTCSNINSKYGTPSTTIYSITPNVSLGNLIVAPIYNMVYNKMVDGTYNQLTIQFLGTDLQPISILDPNMTILLSIKENDD